MIFIVSLQMNDMEPYNKLSNFQYVRFQILTIPPCWTVLATWYPRCVYGKLGIGIDLHKSEIGWQGQEYSCCGTQKCCIYLWIHLHSSWTNSKKVSWEAQRLGVLTSIRKIRRYYPSCSNCLFMPADSLTSKQSFLKTHEFSFNFFPSIILYLSMT